MKEYRHEKGNAQRASICLEALFEKSLFVNDRELLVVQAHNEIFRPYVVVPGYVTQSNACETKHTATSIVEPVAQNEQEEIRQLLESTGNFEGPVNFWT